MMTMDAITFVDDLKRRFAERVGDTVRAELGDITGKVLTNTRNRVLVRVVLATDSSGNIQYSPAFLVHAGANPSYRPSAGYMVQIGLNKSGDLAIIEADTRYLDAVDEDVQASNPRLPNSRFITPDLWVEGYNTANATANTPSTEVSVAPMRYVTAYNEQYLFAGGAINLETLIPVSDKHRLALVYLDTTTNALDVSTSTVKSLFSPFGETDINECLQGMPVESIPLGMYRLSNAQSTVTDRDKWADMRGFINAPPKLGFPQVVRMRERVHADYAVVAHGVMTVAEGVLTVKGTLWIK